VKRRTQGFSLIEVLVAFVILSLSLGVLMQIFSGGLSRIGISKEYAHAAALAESRLAYVGVETPVEEGETQGDDGQGYTWTTAITRYTHPDFQASSNPSAPNLFQVDVVVTWGEGLFNKRSFRLTSVRLGLAS